MPIDPRCRIKAEEETKNHWAAFPTRPLHPNRVRDYIQKLLPLELECAKSDLDSPPRLPPPEKQGKILVLMTGFSIDPLLQAICAYKPKQVVLLLNVEYGKKTKGGYGPGEEFGKRIAGFLPDLPCKWVAATPPVRYIVLEKDERGRPKDQPGHVFRKLREELIPLLQRKEQVILDITGGKKSMVTGAYLFGAFTGVEISYVDFDEYDPEERHRPLGYTCRIGALPNPYEMFKLREWEQARELYRQYSFRAARELLSTQLIPAMKELFEQRDIDAANTLCTMLEVYEFWDNGDYKRALEAFAEIKGRLVKSELAEILKAKPDDRPEWQLPTAVEILGTTHPNSEWIHAGGSASVDAEACALYRQVEKLKISNDDLRTSLYVDGTRLFTYAKDELEKIKRLIQWNEDFRSALLRAAGLNEVLIKARLIALWLKGWLLIKQTEEFSTRSELDDPIPIDIGLAKVANAKNMLDTLNGRGNLTWGSGAQKFNIAGDRIDYVSKFWTGLDDSLRRLVRRSNKSEKPTLFDLRNDAIHFCLSVPKSLADAGCEIAEANLRDLKGNWAPFMCSAFPDEVYTETVAWSKLCAMCGVDFLATTE
jgi:tetratricopeptide (TPR) repeat protein